MNPALHHGAPSWSELMTGDAEKAAEFYTKVFPWTLNTVDMPTGPYHLFMMGERPVAGAMKLPMEGVPTAWGFYFTVNDVDQALAKAESLGATRQYDPMEVPGTGRMAGILDPQGAYLSLIAYEPMENQSSDEPAFLAGFTTPGLFSWYSLQTSDVEAAKKFYAELLGWTFQTEEMPMGPYTTFKVNGVGMGGITPPMQPGIPPHWASYITVENADETSALAAEHGGTVIAPPFDIPTVGRNAVIQDPTGGIINVIKYVPMEQPA